MDNIWILTEERPKLSVIKTILEYFQRDFTETVTFYDGFNIRPIIQNGVFTFRYLVEGVMVSNIGNVFIEIVSGSSSFVDYILVRQEERPENHSLDNILMVVEETKTSDAESRNTGIYQRASKFVYANHYCPNANKYMLYNEEMTPDENRIPTDTNIFGTNMLLTVGVEFIGKTMDYFNAFDSIDELIEQKNRMNPPNRTNTPIRITRQDDCIYISGKLDKARYEGKISHDPNIGALNCIGFCLRSLGWQGQIQITNHNITQEYIDNARGNKCLLLFQLLNITMEGLNIPIYNMHENYWNYCSSSEKVASILLHLTCQYSGIHGIYENHAGCERGYFRTQRGGLIALPKKDRNKNNLLLPDVVLCDNVVREIYDVEGKLLSTMRNGIAEVETYDAIEQEYILPNYPGFSIKRWVSVFGGELHVVPHEKVLIYLNQYGNVYINNAAPENIKNAFRRIGIEC